MLDLRRFKKRKIFKFSNRQISILCGMLLGDGTMEFSKTAKNPSYRFSVRHGPKQLLYSHYIYNCFSNTNCKIKKVFIKENTLNGKIIKAQYQSEVRIPTNPYLKELYSYFYPQGKKIIPFSLLNKYYTKEALAFHFMDDGSKNCDSNGNIQGFVFSMQSFSLKEVEHFKWFILGRFKLKSAIYIQNGKPILRIQKESVNTFINLVKPYIIESLKYKISPCKTS